MSAKPGPKSSAEKVREYRARKRAQGYRLMQRWVPDVDSLEYRERARRASRAVAKSPYARQDQDFVDAVSILNDLPDEAS